MRVPAARKVLSSSNEARISILDDVFLLLLLFKQLNLHRPYKDVTDFYLGTLHISRTAWRISEKVDGSRSRV